MAPLPARRPLPRAARTSLSRAAPPPPGPPFARPGSGRNESIGRGSSEVTLPPGRPLPPEPPEGRGRRSGPQTRELGTPGWGWDRGVAPGRTRVRTCCRRSARGRWPGGGRVLGLQKAPVSPLSRACPAPPGAERGEQPGPAPVPAAGRFPSRRGAGARSARFPSWASAGPRRTVPAPAAPAPALGGAERSPLSARNTFLGAERKPVFLLNFRRKSRALALGGRDLSPSSLGASHAVSSRNICRGTNPPWRADRAGFKPRELIKKILAAGAVPRRYRPPG